MFAYLPGVVATEPLLILGGLYNNDVPDLLEHVNVCLVLLLGLLLIIEVNPRGIEVEVEGDGRFSP